MPKRYPAKIICCFVLVLLCKTTFAQADVDSAVYDAAVTNVVNRFYQGVGEQSRLYNGLVYDSYDSSIKGNAYLDDIDGWRSGSVAYDGQTFENVPMIYDLYTDQLVVLLYNHASPFALIPNKVSSFDLHARHFIRVAGTNTGIKSGFYEQLYGGRSQALKKVEKVIKSTSASTGRERYFTLLNETPDYFIKKGNTYYKVNSQGAVLNLFVDKKKELKQYIKDKHIQFDGLFELALTSVAKYYDSLTN
ncbi:hypothetical protein [Mucilaginibacter sp.]|uniref:hypothetical protein n=1 Tax=Mucilaginibacter sp. TaxID=1882438 RepID=UPI0025D7B6EB|nr:hypothetical protein [Mucilaginibacter sp.]